MAHAHPGRQLARLHCTSAPPVFFVVWPGRPVWVVTTTTTRRRRTRRRRRRHDATPLSHSHSPGVTPSPVATPVQYHHVRPLDHTGGHTGGHRVFPRGDDPQLNGGRGPFYARSFSPADRWHPADGGGLRVIEVPGGRPQ